MPADARKRVYEAIVREHLVENRQMVFLSGPRQCGKTTLAESFASNYLTWDDADVRAAIVAGQAETVRRYGLDKLSSGKRVVVFDEVHKYPRWKGFLKGFFDVYGKGMKIIATGSAKMNVYKRGGDSMMGRYFPYRMHPFSVAELLDASLPDESLVRRPRPIDEADWSALVEFGGFPEPFMRRNRRFSGRWAALRMEQLMLEDIRTLTQVQELEQIRIWRRISCTTSERRARAMRSRSYLTNRSSRRTVLRERILSLFLPERSSRSWSDQKELVTRSSWRKSRDENFAMTRLIVVYSRVKQKNPFITAGYAGEDYFCDRIRLAHRHLASRRKSVKFCGFLQAAWLGSRMVRKRGFAITSNRKAM